jgi:hypothetical protein
LVFLGKRGSAFTVAGMRRTKGLRYAAMRKAHEAKQMRDAKRLRRERQVEAALAEYFEHVAVVEAVEAATAARVAEVTAVGAAEARRVRAAAGLAVRAMLDLGETRTAVAELTGLPLSGVRELAAAALDPGVVVTLDAQGVRSEGADITGAVAEPGPEPDWSVPWDTTDVPVSGAGCDGPVEDADAALERAWPPTVYSTRDAWTM